MEEVLNLLDVTGCLCSTLTVWKEDKSGAWGCVQARERWSPEEEVHMRPGQHCLCEFGDTGNDTR